MKKFYLLFFAAVFLFVLGHSQPVLRAFVTTNILGTHQETEYKLLVENANKVQKITPPVFKNFEIVSGPASESAYEERNGVIKKFTGYSWRIKPNKTGTLTIAAGQANADGLLLKSNMVQVQVTNADVSTNATPLTTLGDFALPKVQSATTDYVLETGENLVKKIERNIFLKVEANKKAVYVGEPVIVTYKLYTRLKSESDIIKSPAFNGFSVVDLAPASDGNYQVEYMDGIAYNVYLVRKAQLYALLPGTYALENAVVENNVEFIKGAFANEPNPPEAAYIKEKITLTSKPVLLQVKPLPGADSLKNFAGTVGEFDIAASTPANELTTADAGEVIVTIAGAGNLLLVSAPVINWPDALEVLEPQVSESINRLQVPVTGTKTWRYRFTAAQAGQYKIPAIQLLYFNPTTAKFETKTTQTLVFTIASSTGKTASLPKASSPNLATKMLHNRWLMVIPVTLLILAGVGLWWHLDRKKQNRAKPETVPLSPIVESKPTPAIWQTEQHLYESISDKDWLAMLLADIKHITDTNALQSTNPHHKAADFLHQLNTLYYTPLDAAIGRAALLQQAKQLFGQPPQS
jgi:hypothetical protein